MLHTPDHKPSLHPPDPGDKTEAVNPAPSAAPSPRAIRTSAHEPSPSTSNSGDKTEALLDTSWLLFPQPSPPPVDLPTPRADEPVDAELLRSLSRIKFLRGLSPANLERIARAGRVRAYARYSSLAKEGLASSTFFGLLSGKLMSASSWRRSTVDASSVRQLHSELGDDFGEECLIAESKREDSVGALTDARVFVLTREELVRAPAELARELRMLAQWTVAQKAAVLQRLSRLVYWGEVEERVQGLIAGMLEVMHVDTGTTLFYEGSTVDASGGDDQARYWYIFLEGHIRMTKLGRAQGKAPVDYTPQSTGNDGGDGPLRPWFGEYALWFSKARKATAVAMAPSLLLGMRETHFAAFLELVPDFLASSTFATGRRRALVAVQTRRPSIVPSGEAGNLASAASLRWHSHGRLGARVGSTSLMHSATGAGGRRSIFADRWERMVFGLLFNAAKQEELGQAGGKRRASVSTVSLKVEDFNQAPGK
jgi:CRP-like cAMP-binding protein